MDDSICECGADNLTDYLACPACAAKVHFTHRDCRCASCARPAIEVRLSARGTYDFTPPFSNEAFLDEFYLRIGKPFRFWNTRAGQWEIRPLEPAMMDLIVKLLEKHFSGYRVVRSDAAALVAA